MTTVNVQVGASSDDGHQIATGTSPNINANEVGTIDADNEWGGYRWLDVTVPNAATINTATCDFYFSFSSGDEPKHDMDFEAHDDAPTFIASTNNMSDRTLTGNPVLYDDTDLGAPGTFTSPSLVTPLQAVVDRSGWLSGKAVVLMVIQPTTEGARDWLTKSYDGDTALAAKLDIDYTAAAAARRIFITSS